MFGRFSPYPGVRRAVSVALLALSLCLPVDVQAQTVAQREEKIKAALIFKLIKFVDWPAEIMPGKLPIQICALGDTPVGRLLAEIDGKHVRDRTAQFHSVDGLSANDLRGCHVLYVLAGSREIAASLPPSLRRKGLLTISDAQDFTRRGGIIGLVRSENKMAFEINLKAARENGLEPSAPLLELATVVE